MPSEIKLCIHIRQIYVSGLIGLSSIEGNQFSHSTELTKLHKHLYKYTFLNLAIAVKCALVTELFGGNGLLTKTIKGGRMRSVRIRNEREFWAFSANIVGFIANEDMWSPPAPPPYRIDLSKNRKNLE